MTLPEFQKDDEEPRVVGGYELIEPLAEGGTAVVWRAYDRTLDRQVALKELRDRSPEAIALFEREAKLAARLTHPNIVPIHAVGPGWLAMELVQGRTLQRMVHRWPLARRLEAVLEVARTVAYAHGAGVIHRDLKPQNIIAEDESGRVHLIDFGLAKLVGGRSDVSGGTEPYMAPEQLDGKPTDRRTDVWALGAILYEMIAGRRAHLGRERDARDPLVGVVRPLAAIVDRAMAVEAASRYPDAAAFAVDLERFLKGRAPATTGPRRRAVIAVAALVVAALASLALWPRSEGVSFDDAEQCVRAALRLRRAGDARGGRELMSIVERLPSNADGWCLRGRMWRVLQEEGKALECQERALQREPSHVAARYEQWVLLSRAGHASVAPAAEELSEPRRSVVAGGEERWRAAARDELVAEESWERLVAAADAAVRERVLGEALAADAGWVRGWRWRASLRRKRGDPAAAWEDEARAEALERGR